MDTNQNRFVVLVVEDNQDLQFAFALSLEMAGVREVLQAYTLEQAEGFISAYLEGKKRFDTILMDGSIHSRAGEPDTLSLIKKIRSCFPGPIVAISGDEESVRLMMEAGCTDSMPKPFSHDTLKKKVFEWMT